jgi:HxlR-like helix-turn-helix protein
MYRALPQVPLLRPGMESCLAEIAARWSYRLTEQGQDLKAVCDAMGQWGARWLEIEPHHRDPAYVLWATTKLVDAAKLPDRTVIVRFELRDRPGDSYWLLLVSPSRSCAPRAPDTSRTSSLAPTRSA